jgi:hypothetical protein
MTRDISAVSKKIEVSHVIISKAYKNNVAPTKQQQRSHEAKMHFGFRYISTIQGVLSHQPFND